MLLSRRDLWWPAGAAVVLAVTSLVAARDRVAPGETAVFRAFNDLTSSVQDPVGVFMVLGTLTGVVVVAAVVGVVTMRVGPPLAVVGAGLLARVLAPWLKEVVTRGRPAELMTAVRLREDPGGPGFPSAHAAIATAIAVVVAACFPRLRWPILVVALLVGVARMYVGVHLPLDVVGGVALGVLAATPPVVALHVTTARSRPRDGRVEG